MLNYPVFRREASWAPLAELHREMNRLFDDIWSPGLNTSRALNAEWRPAAEVEEAEDHYLLSLEMAGVPRDQIKIEVVDNQIMISGERSRQIKHKQEGQTYSERQFGKFQRSFALPTGVDASRVEANCQDGILRVYIPKAESAKPRQIKITDGKGSFLGRVFNSKDESKKVEATSSFDKAV